jgi:hypothetical protein
VGLHARFQNAENANAAKNPPFFQVTNFPLFTLHLTVMVIEMKGITRGKLTIISESAICKKFLGHIWSYAVSL